MYKIAIYDCSNGVDNYDCLIIVEVRDYYLIIVWPKNPKMRVVHAFIENNNIM